jgi:hypothetical protein
MGFFASTWMAFLRAPPPQTMANQGAETTSVFLFYDDFMFF